MITVGPLARRFGLSRTALLHYDRLGLLRPAGRTAAGHRRYDEADVRRLEQICTLRRAGLPLAEIARVLAGKGNALTAALEARLEQLDEDVERLRGQQRFILGLLRADGASGRIRVMSKQRWTALLAAAGFDEAAMRRWHADFERHAPEEHQRFLEFLCLPDHEIAAIRRRARQASRDDRGTIRGPGPG